MKIIGTGSALPKKIVTNDMLSEFLDTSDAWILPRTGIKSRHVISDETIEGLGEEACRKALDMSGLTPKDIDFFIVSNVVSEHVTPGLGCIISERIGLTCPTIDINCACPGFIYALDIAETYYKAGKVRNVLIACTRDVEELLQDLGIAKDDVSWYMVHQANRRIIDAIIQYMEQPQEKFPVNITDHGNSSSASCPILLDECNRKGLFKSGDLMVLSAFGAGLLSGVAVLEW